METGRKRTARGCTGELSRKIIIQKGRGERNGNSNNNKGRKNRQNKRKKAYTRRETVINNILKKV